jgi:uncharacterized protein
MTGSEGTDAETRELLMRARTIAVVGLSDKAERDSNDVARYLQSQGYRIIPVNPLLREVLGETAYPSLSAIPATVRVDIVDIFRRSEEVPAIVREAIDRGVGAIWMQLGIESPAARSEAEARHIPVRENQCIKIEHGRLRVGPVNSPGSGSPSPSLRGEKG